MGYITLAKYAVIAIVLGVIVFAIHSNGREIERARCLQEWQEFIAQSEQERINAEAQRAKEKRAYDENLMRVINDKQKAQANLNRSMHELRTSGLWIDAKACPSGNPMPRKTQSSSVVDSTAGTDRKIRLPEPIEESLLSIAYDADELAGKYTDLRNICLPLVDVIN